MITDVKADPVSRFKDTDLVFFDGVDTMGTWVAPWFITNPELLTADQIGIWTVTNDQVGRPDKIASSVYRSAFLDWIIIAFNNAVELGWPQAGITIKYPKPEVVFAYLS